MQLNYLNKSSIAVVGLGYVGLPLAIELSKKYPTIGLDIDENRIDELNLNIDSTNEVSSKTIKESTLKFTKHLHDLEGCNIYILTIPTPIDIYNKPDLEPLKQATSSIGDILKVNDIVIYESTVYPGCTEEICVPILEEKSNLVYNKQFFCGYSPERINPGDKNNSITKIVKVTSGSNEETANFVDSLYASIIPAGTHKASSIKVAEASKVIENTQRDLNIAFVNELALIFDKIDIDTNEVLDAASTKWNFLDYRPGLVGGHCISVDPYYLAYKAESKGYYPEVILSGRRLNSNMHKFVISKLIKLMISKNIVIENSNVLILGTTFKENCPDIRNSKVFDIVKGLKELKFNVDVYDTIASPKDVFDRYKFNLVNELKTNFYDSIIVAVPHTGFKKINFKKLLKNNNVVYDIKGMLDIKDSDARL